MSYAPILDPAAASDRSANDRRLALAAAAALQQLAGSGELRAAIAYLGNSADTALNNRIANLASVRQVLQRTGIEKDDLLPRLVSQLRQVKAFGELDGGTVDDYIGPVGSLIRSGRVELFAG